MALFRSLPNGGTGNSCWILPGIFACHSQKRKVGERKCHCNMAPDLFSNDPSQERCNLCTEERPRSLGNRARAGR